jgi:hypothetical protein
MASMMTKADFMAYLRDGDVVNAVRATSVLTDVSEIDAKAQLKRALMKVPMQGVMEVESDMWRKKKEVIPAGGIKPIVVAVGDKNKHPPKAKDGGDKKRAKVTLAQDPCIKNLMFQNLPQHFPTDCIKVACPRRHDLPVTSGRLTAADKRLAVAGIDRLGQGTFKNLCLTHIKSL